MRVTYEVGSYNDRRYGKPWLARVTAWPVGGRPELVFGANVGSRVAEIEAQPGELVKYGQKDNRHNATENSFARVEPDGSLNYLTDTKAREYWLALVKAREDKAKREAAKAARAAKAEAARAEAAKAEAPPPLEPIPGVKEALERLVNALTPLMNDDDNPACDHLRARVSAEYDAARATLEIERQAEDYAQNHRERAMTRGAEMERRHAAKQGEG